MKTRHAIVLIPIFLGATTILPADPVVQIKIGGDDIALPRRASAESGCEPCAADPRPGDRITISIGEGRVRRDREPFSILLRPDAKKLYFLCHRTKQFSHISYPVKYAELKGKTSMSLPEELLEFNLAAPGVAGKGQVGKWPVETFDAKVGNKLRIDFRLHLAVADVGTEAGNSLVEFRKLLHELESGGRGWSRLLPFDRGVPIVWEEAMRQPETEFVYKEEVVTIEERPLPAATYEVPPNYREVKFDPACAQFR